MPLYYFDIFDGHAVASDYEGQELADVASMRLEAEEAARELLAQTILRHAPIDHRELRIRDVDGAVVYVVRFAERLD